MAVLQVNLIRRYMLIWEVNLVCVYTWYILGVCLQYLQNIYLVVGKIFVGCFEKKNQKHFFLF